MIFSTAYNCGTWCAPDQASLALDDRGLMQGAIAVERLRTYRGRLLFVDAYLRRLQQTLNVLGIENAEPPEGFPALLDELVARNHIPSDGTHDVSVVLLVTPGRIGYGPTIIAHLMPLPWRRIDALAKHGQSLVITSVQQVSPESWPRSIKVRSRLHYYLADLQAHRADDQAEGLLVDYDASVTESGTGNLMLFRQGRWQLPPADRVLPGITVGQVVDGLRQRGERITFAPVRRNDLLHADEVIMMGTTAGIWSVTRIDDCPIGTGVPGPRCRELQATWTQRVGIDLWQQASTKVASL